MSSKTFTSGRIRKAEHDASAGRLDLHWDNGTVTAYKRVPQEVYLRLCSAPNPATYWEDRIAEEYPKATPKMQSSESEAAKDFGSLFDDR